MDPKLGLLCLCLVMGVAATDAVKRDDPYQPNGGGGGGGGPSNPVYSPGNGNGNGNGNGGSSLPVGDHQAAASSNSYQSLGPANGGATYYYYYPQHDKSKESSSVNGNGNGNGNGGYKASSSNTYASAVSPNQGSDPGAHEPVGASTDLSYSHDLGSMGSSLHSSEGSYGGHPNGGGVVGGGQNGQNVGYDLSALAAQYASAQQGGGQVFNGGSAFGSQNGGGGPAAYPTGNSFDGGAPPGSYGPSVGGGDGSPFGGSYGQGQGGGGGGGGPSMSQYLQAAAAAAAAANGQQGPQGQGSTGGFPGYGGGGGGQQHFGNYPAASSQSNTYEPSPSGSSGFRRYGIGSIIMPMLALAGLSLLIPTVTSLSGLSSAASSSSSSSRRKRDAGKYEPGIGGMVDRAERYYDMYKTAVVKEECMNRIICQLGDAVSDVRGKQTFFKLMDNLPAAWVGTKAKVFKDGALGATSAKCQKYTC